MPRPSPSQLPRPRRLCLLLLLGLVTNIVTAIVFAQGEWHDRFAGGWDRDRYRYFERGGAQIEWITNSTFGHSRTVIHGIRYDEPVPEGTRESAPPRWASWKRHALRPGEAAILWSEGWPLRALQHGVVSRSGAPPEVWGRWWFDGEEWGSLSPIRVQFVVPLRPIWTGMIANAVCYAALWALVFAAIRRRVHARRKGRGLCPVCRYDLRFKFASGCSECGWGRC